MSDAKFGTFEEPMAIAAPSMRPIARQLREPPVRILIEAALAERKCHSGVSLTN